jgi:hypothetical protein
MKQNVMVAEINNGLLFDGSLSMYPTQFWGVKESSLELNSATSSYYGFVSSGELEIHILQTDKKFRLYEGMYFVASGPLKLKATGQSTFTERIGYRALFQIGGPVEAEGRLTYIDNCRTSLLISPARIGDPCFNLLTFPPNIIQSQHIHPTIRVGVVVSGRGNCITPGAKIPLMPHQWFFLNEGSQHSFESSSEGLKIVAFHPDSDWGPSDQVHPMLNRTYLTGK